MFSGIVDLEQPGIHGLTPGCLPRILVGMLRTCKHVPDPQVEDTVALLRRQGLAPALLRHSGILKGKPQQTLGARTAVGHDGSGAADVAARPIRGEFALRSLEDSRPTGIPLE